MKYARTKSGLPPLSLADAARITSTRCDAVYSLEGAIAEVEETLESSDLLEHFIEEDGTWNDEIAPLINHYHDLQKAYLALTGGPFQRIHDAVRWIEPQLQNRKKLSVVDYGQCEAKPQREENPAHPGWFI